MADFFDVVSQQRACRSFAPDPIDDDVMAQVLQAATFAPSAENHQPWVFVVVRDPDRRAQLADLARQVWDDWARANVAADSDPHILRDVDQATHGGFASAAAFVVVCADTELCMEEAIGSSIFPATQNLLLAANALGLGSALITLPLYAGDGLAKLLELPPTVKPMAVVPLGRPARTLAAPRRHPFTTRTYRESFGTNW
jgi:nitroreductase